MSRLPDPSLDRRQLLRTGGAAISLGALLAACGTGRTGLDAPGRLGVADDAPELGEGDVDDVVLLRTAQSIEYNAIAVYDAATTTGALDVAATSLAARFVEDHTGHAAAIGALIDDNGGEQFTCPNPFLTNRVVVPVLGALEDTDDLVRDLLNTAHAFEAHAAASYQALVALLQDPMLRSEAMRIGGDENRHAAALARVINPDEIFSPALFGEPVGNDPEGFPIPYAVPATFGQLTGITLVVGARDEEGSRLTVQLQTPAANSLVYEDQSC